MDTSYRTQLEDQYIGQFSLTSGSIVSPTFDLPKGELWYEMNLLFTIPWVAATSPTGNTAYTDDVLELINQVRLEVNRDGVICDVPGKALYRRAEVLRGTLPEKDNNSLNVNAAATYTMVVNLPIIFADPRMARPEDTALATDRYNFIKLSVGLGAATDLLSVNNAGAFSFGTCTCDIEIKKLKGPIPDAARPIAVGKFLTEGSNFNVASVTQQSLARNYDRAIKRLFVHAGNKATQGRNWSGNESSSIVSVASLQSDLGNHQDARRERMIRQSNKNRFSLETIRTGVYVFDFVTEDLSNLSALKTGDKAYLNYTQTNNGSLPAGTNCVSIASEVLVSLQA